MSYDEIVGKLNPDTKKMLLDASDITAERLLTPSISLNKALGGGLGYGRQVTFWGTKSAGKSALAQQCIAQAQRDGKVCAWVDVENSFESDWARTLGVDTKELIVTRKKSTDPIMKQCVDFMQVGVDVIVIDSISSIVPSAHIDKSGDLKDFSDQGAMGSDSRDMGKLMRGLNMVNDNTLLILISQTRMAPKGPMFWGAVPTGGKATEYYSSQGIQVTSNAGDTIKDEVTEGDRVFEAQIGRKVNFMVVWNKLGPQGRTGSYDFYFDKHPGIDTHGEVFDLAVEFQLIDKNKGWMTYGDVKLNGRQNMVDYFRANPDKFAALSKEVYERL